MVHCLKSMCKMILFKIYESEHKSSENIQDVQTIEM